VKYQFVLQWPASSIKDYDTMIEIEETIIKTLGDLGKVDGHDAGSGEMNIFIFTDNPQLAFERINSSIGTRDFMSALKAAYRKIGSDEFTILHPKNLTHFSIA
jgi:hypothetical protein